MDSVVRCFPIRHHSPACALHLMREMAAFEPDIILIEGPGDTNELLAHIGSPENTAPMCIYYSYAEKGEDGFRSACYYPLLDFSPELCAIRHGVAHGVETRFIDLPYSSMAFLGRRDADGGDEPGSGPKTGVGNPDAPEEPDKPETQEKQEAPESKTGGSGTAGARGAESGSAKPSYFDDYYLFRSAYIQKLCEKEGCRHEGELWEKLFEMFGMRMETADFVRAMRAFCHYSRVDYPAEMLAEEGCIEREARMAAGIREAMRDHGRVLAVMGGFHVEAVEALVAGAGSSEEAKAKAQTKAEAEADGDVAGETKVAADTNGDAVGATPLPKPKGESKAWLIPYSFEESDQLSGYASGMPYPAFYQAVFEAAMRGVGAISDTTGSGSSLETNGATARNRGLAERSGGNRSAGSTGGAVAGNAEAGLNDAWTRTVLRASAEIGNVLRKNKETTSIADEVAANVHAVGLADLRDKPFPGVYELLDAVRSAYVKGALDFSARRVMDLATENLRGNRIGEIASGAEEPPLLTDFRSQAKALRLKISATTTQDVMLDILTKKNHRAISVFLHRMDYLETGFAELRAGPNFRHRDTKLVREHWTYAVGARVESRIIDVSYLGGTVREAASTMLVKKRSSAAGSGAYSALLIDAAVMNLTEHVQPLLSDMKAAVAEDGSFDSLTEALRNLVFTENAGWLLALNDAGFAEELLRDVYQKCAVLLPELKAANEDEDRKSAGNLKDLRQASKREGADGSIFLEGLHALYLRSPDLPPPCLQGAAAGLLYAEGVLPEQSVLDMAGAYLFGSGDMTKRIGRFLAGLFQSAWDIVFTAPDGDGNAFLDGVGGLLARLPHEEFLGILPDLRLAFSTFTPSQIDRISRIVARMLGAAEALDAPGYREDVYALGLELDRMALAR